MEEKKKKKQDEKKKKEATQKKAVEQKHRVPESAKPRSGVPPPADPTATPGSSSGGDGKRPSPSGPQQQQQQPPPLSVPRHPPRELPPRFRQHEHKQLLRRGQPLPTGSPPPGTTSQPLPTNQHTELSQYETPHGGGLPPISANWDQVIVDEQDAKTWPRVSCGDSCVPTKCDTTTTREGTKESPQVSYPGNHSGIVKTAGLESSSKGWGLGPANSPAVIGGEGKADGHTASRGPSCWSSSSVNLNPSANPSAWPMLGQEGVGTTLGRNAPPPGLCSAAWGGTTTSNSLETPASPSTSTSVGAKPQNCDGSGPNRSNWGSSNPISDWEGVATSSSVPPRMANREDASGVSAWDLGTTTWGRGDAGGAAAGWGQNSAQATGCESAESPQQEAPGSWNCVAGTPSSDGSSDSQEGPPRHRKRPPRQEANPSFPAHDMDPRVLSNTGWGQTPVQQHTAWETEEGGREGRGGDPKPRTEISPGWGGPSRAEPHTDRKVTGGTPGWVSGSAGACAGTPEEMPHSWHSCPVKPKPPQSWSDGPTSGWGARGGGEDMAEPTNGKSGPPKSAWEGEGDGWKESTLAWGGSAREVGGAWGDKLPPPEQSSRGGSNAVGRGGPTLAKPGSSGWVGGSGGGAAGQREHSIGEPTGWEDPSPPSLLRKMEIDDGTSAWGDPSAYSKAINLWDKNKPPSSPEQGGQPQHGIARHSQLPGNPSRPQKPGTPGRTAVAAAGWMEKSGVPPKAESTWGQPASPSSAMDNGTSAWGKPPTNCGGWETEGPETPGPFNRGSAPPASASHKPAAKSMQEGWGGCSTEEPTADMWSSSTTPQESSSWSSLTRKAPQKGKPAKKQEEAWILSHLIKQLTDMGFPRDPVEEVLKNTGMNLDQAMSVLLEKKAALDKRGLVGGSDYSNGVVHKPAGCRTALLPKDPALERPAFGENQSGVFGNSGAPLAQSIHQQHQAPPPLSMTTPLNSSQTGHRAQVPQLLSPQVQAQLLQLATKGVGLNPGLLTSPVNPQHTSLLNQLYQLQLASQRLQIQQQMLQSHRGTSGPIRQQEQQIARTISSMQQQIQQQQSRLAQALLKKQQSPASSHPSAAKSTPDGFAGHHSASGLSDMQTKEPQPCPSSYVPYSVSGLNLNVNVAGIETDGLCAKDPTQPQSRLSQWTHPSPREAVSELAFSKYGSISKLGLPPAKPLIDSSFSPYTLHPSAESPTNSLVPSDAWGQVKATGDKISNGTSVSWPPEFCPGVPWKGLQSVDPETDPDATPGSIPIGPTVNTSIQDVNRYLLRDGNPGKPSDKPTWSPAPSKGSLSHELWKGFQGPRNTVAPPRPPPGLTNAKPSSAWGGSALSLAPGWSTSSYSGSRWDTDSSSRTSSWLVLRNLTPQIDGSTLRTLCLQHGPLLTFHLSLSQGSAVVRYSSTEEAAKAQKSLHMCVLGNTTILAEFAGEEELTRFFAQGRSLTPPVSNQGRLGLAGAGPSHSTGQWSDGRVEAPDSSSGGSNADLLWGGAPSQYSSLWGSSSREDGRLIGSPAPISTLLPGDLLSGESL